MMECQARICPVCMDDHLETRECEIKDLKLRIATLKEKISLFKFYGTDGCFRCDTGRITTFYLTKFCTKCEMVGEE